ncbi:MAG TPA: DUF3618 domain-containing protein [Solirubrobacteraceae bacterium]|jgi:hypothetical protein|nr:DUF3618 domain-containing protein [Solirubrobacteraceae bacterium]
MGESQGPAGEAVGSGQDRTPEQVQEEIVQTRLEMGETVAQLAAKTDIKAQAHRAVDNAKATVKDKATDVKSNAEVKKDELTATARDAMPASAEAARHQVISRARQHRAALIAVAALSAGILIGKRRR